MNEQASPGRIASTFTSEGALVVLWMEESDQEAILRLQEFSPDGTSWPAIDVAPVRAARDSGFPQVVAIGNRLLVSYSAVDDEGLSSVITLLGTLKEMTEG